MRGGQRERGTRTDQQTFFSSRGERKKKKKKEIAAAALPPLFENKAGQACVHARPSVVPPKSVA